MAVRDMGNDPEFFQKSLGKGGFILFNPEQTEDSPNSSAQPDQEEADSQSEKEFLDQIALEAKEQMSGDYSSEKTDGIKSPTEES